MGIYYLYTWIPRVRLQGFESGSRSGVAPEGLEFRIWGLGNLAPQNAISGEVSKQYGRFHQEGTTMKSLNIAILIMKPTKKDSQFEKPYTV